ncbi:two-component system activity regulator YycH [Niallia alba]|jgi:regulatory protein YycH of two-component signal transduction system YycFG|uniref:Regulatory protein YycH domain-containing protein n=1 Tax=Niallia circulans TaxID=1397 RepID=A0A941JPG1_NIACI|nr:MULTISPECIES: two-component system activity regulator YycH [Niallia]MCB5239312.1 two-component system activity regulator YycH [Niallia circulans]MDU1845619.1 two-component system activity regulator YycH [Niallia nealsonii]MED3791049.1 two-component system activity regulator YycH [Niallia alba]
MKYESVKSGILIFLVALSVLLYYLLWTDQGREFDAIDNSGSTMAQEELGDKKEVSEVVKPDEIYQHIDGIHYGTISKVEIDAIINKLKEFEYEEFRNVTSSVDGIANFLEEQDNSLEIRFPGQVPFRIYKDILSIDQDNSFDFDTILFSYKDGTVYFLSKETEKVYETTIHAKYIEQLNKLKENVYAEKTVYSTYFSYKPNNQYLIYLPNERKEVNKYKYFTRQIESIRMKRALFTDPSIAQKEILTNWEEYTDDSGLLRIYKDTHIVSFFKPSGISNEMTQKHIINNSIELINQRGGWINDYLYVGRDEDRKITFRLYNTNGMPVFNLNTELSDIRLYWENNKAKRLLTSNLVIINTTTPFDFSKETVSSGEEVLQYLQSNKKLKTEKLQNIVIGYDMQVDSQNIVSLQPTWFYQYDHKWYTLYSEGTGGNLDGLE